MATTNGSTKRPVEEATDAAEDSTKKAKPTELVKELKELYKELCEFITEKKCAPILVRLAWHDCGTYDKDIKEWPACGGANASIRFDPEINHAPNAGLSKAVALMEDFKSKYPQISYADIYQAASAAAIQVCGGPTIELRYGRVDVDSPEQCPPETRLPGAKAPFGDGSANAAEHLKKIFHRMGFTNKDIVSLSGAHTLGRAFKDRSGLGEDSTKYTEKVPEGVTKGGSSWTPEWLKFDNSYFVEIKEKRDENLLVMETDACIFEDGEFKEHAELYATDQDAFFSDYAEAHKKLSELGAKWINDKPITIASESENNTA